MYVYSFVDLFVLSPDSAGRTTNHSVCINIYIYIYIFFFLYSIHTCITFIATYYILHHTMYIHICLGKITITQNLPTYKGWFSFLVMLRKHCYRNSYNITFLKNNNTYNLIYIVIIIIIIFFVYVSMSLQTYEQIQFHVNR